MHDPLNAGRRLASRAIAWQVGATALAALAFSTHSAPWALGAAMGGGAVVAGALASAWLALGGGIQTAGPAMARLLLGVVAKWLVVFVVLVSGLAGLGLPPLPMLAGVLAATLAYVLAHLFRR